ncbi:MAG TPA: enolase C-terminal domain-like protein [Vicinamibacterales bacterium]|nr:enolase C-terminal domain-like protein [Vicinamibacterales bacterium]
MTRASAPIGSVEASAFVFPTDAPESDGTAEWQSTTIVIAEVSAGGHAGIGYTYADAAAAHFIRSVLTPAIRGMDALDTNRLWTAMTVALRNNGRPGIASAALSAVDNALWDLKGRLLGVAVVDLLGAARADVPVYGSGGFTSYSIERLQEQLGGWVAQGITRVKMKIGRHPRDDVERVAAARQAIGASTALFVDANGAYTRKQALGQAVLFADQGVSWFEEPVSSDDLDGLALLVDRAPAGMDIAAGEYGYDLSYFRRMLDARAVDVLQADATRCGGITGFMRAAALAEAFGIPLSAHTAPSLHVHPCAAVAAVQHIEYFHDHERLEHLFFDGAATPVAGVLRPDRDRPGLGIDLRRADAEPYRQA